MKRPPSLFPVRAFGRNWSSSICVKALLWALQEDSGLNRPSSNADHWLSVTPPPLPETFNFQRIKKGVGVNGKNITTQNFSYGDLPAFEGLKVLGYFFLHDYAFLSSEHKQMWLIWVLISSINHRRPKGDLAEVHRGALNSKYTTKSRSSAKEMTRPCPEVIIFQRHKWRKTKPDKTEHIQSGKWVFRLECFLK